MANEPQAPAAAQQAPKVRTASQRLDDLEKGLMGLYQAADNIARDTTTLKEAVKILGNKIDAIVKLTVKGEDLSDDSITKVMIQNNVDDLKSKVDGLVASGQLALTSDPLTLNTFVVGREVNAEGEVANPRLQFVVGSLNADLQPKLVGKTAGDVIEFQEGKLKFEILEAYTIVPPAPPAAPDAPPADAAPAADATPATPAPAATQSSTDDQAAAAPTTPAT
jgi:hypothetical protein